MTCLALCTTWLSPCFSLCPPPSCSLWHFYLLSTLSPSPFPPFLYDLQVYFTTWFPQCPPISLGQRCPPLEASALCSVSPPLPPPKPSSTPLPNQPPHAWPPCPHLCPSRCHRPSTAAHSRSCTALLLPRSPCPLHRPCTAPLPRQYPRTLTPCHPLGQTPSSPPVCPTPLSTIRELSHPSLSPSPPPLPPLLLCPLLPLLPPLSLPPLCQPPPPLVHLQCTTPLGCPLHHRPAAQVVVGACGGHRACMAPSPPPSSPAPGLDRV